MLLVVDSAREVDLGLVPYFSQEILGDNEIFVADSALRHLDVAGHRKEFVEVYFDIAGMAKMFAGSMTGPTTGEAEDSFPEQLQAKLDEIV